MLRGANSLEQIAVGRMDGKVRRETIGMTTVETNMPSKHSKSTSD